MKRLFGHKPKSAKPSKDFGEELPKQPQFSTPLYQKLATTGAQVHGSNISQPSLQHSTQQIPSPSEDDWQQQAVPPVHQQPYPPPPLIHTPSRSNSLNSIPHMPAASLPPPPRSASPMSTMSMGGTRLLRPHDQDRKVAPSALGILGALNPPRTDGALHHRSGDRGYSEGSRTETITPSESGHGHGHAPSDREKEKKKGFWSRDKEKEKEREKEREREREREKEWQREVQQRKEEYDRGQRERPRDGPVRREEDPQDELTRMIGYLTATASEDWSLVLEVCERASANEASAKEAVRALRREFKYGEPAAQLSAARLWAIMLRNSSDMFITQSTSRKFLDTLEDLLSSARTSPVVRERLLEVVGAAAYASGSKKGNDREGFKGLWRRVKPFDKPEEVHP
ncbi:hypothetical protein CPB83DRAFT_279639 [Crepidotus variabilis]|uniref:VHS domain-containing protein n=1 Tax=Crepidotus variabilis TaxID=179855 RepID=A0A9P6EHN2_9AGAR|nr:hypothetical protein CPB83DRAFT_279639 [Crepidotus variabilis]